MALLVFRLGMAVGVTMLAGWVNAQTLLQTPSDTGSRLLTPNEANSPTTETPPTHTALPLTTLIVPSEADACQQSLALLAAESVRIAGELKQERENAATRLSQLDAESERKLQECMADDDLNTRTSIALNEKLYKEQRKSQDLTAQLAAAQVEIARLTARLAEKGIGLTPGFAYFDNDLTGSFMTLADVMSKVETSDRVEAADCAGAIGWTEKRERPAMPLRRQVWVWDAGRPMLCSRDPAGAVKLTPPRPTDEAHVLIFR